MNYSFKVLFFQVLLALAALLCIGVEEGAARGDTLSEGRRWTLAECVAEAKSRSLDATDALLRQQSAREDLLSAWWSLSPTISAGASYELNFGRAIDYGSNTVSNDLQSLNMSVSAGLVLFQGLARIYEIKSSQLGLRAAEARQLATERAITLRVVQAFLNMLYQRDLVASRRYQVEAIARQAELASVRQKAGLVTAGDVLDMQAQLASEQQALVEAQNGEHAAMVALLQLMDYRDADTLQIVAPRIAGEGVPPLPPHTADGLFEEAARDYPALRAAQLTEQQARQRVRIAQSGYMPSLSLNAGFGTGARKFLHEEQHRLSEGYDEQLKNNSSVYVGLSLRVPIFDGLSTRGRVQQARISARQSEVATRRASQDLYNIMQQAWSDAQSAYKRYQSAKSSAEALRLTASWAEKKRAVGAISSYDYTQTRSRLNVAETTLLQSRFTYVFKLLVLDIYRGVTVEL